MAKKKQNIQTVTYSPPATVKRFHQSEQFIRFLMGPVGSAKTTACCMEIFTRAREQRPNSAGIRKTRWAIVRNSFPILKTTTIKSWLDWFPESTFGPIKFDSPIVHYLKYKLPDNTTVDCEVLFMSADQESDLKKFPSLEITGAWLNEAKEIRRDIFEIISTRVGRYPSKRDGGPTWSGVILDSNPPDTLHWLHRLFVEQKPKEWGFFKQPSGTSPEGENVENLPDDYYKNMAVGKDEDWVRVYVHGEFGFSNAGKPVHPAFSYSTHVNANLEPLPNTPVVIGLDFGLTPAASFMQKNSAFGHWQVTDEIVFTDGNAMDLASEISRTLSQRYPDTSVIHIWGDPAGGQRAQTDGQTIFDLLWRNGIDAQPAPGSNIFSLRKNALDGLLKRLNVEGKPAIQFAPNCRTLIAGLSGAYKFKKVQVSGDERYSEKPDKGPESHVCEALHYGILGTGEDGGSVLLSLTNQPARRFNTRKCIR